MGYSGTLILKDISEVIFDTNWKKLEYNDFSTIVWDIPNNTQHPNAFDDYIYKYGRSNKSYDISFNILSQNDFLHFNDTQFQIDTPILFSFLQDNSSTIYPNKDNDISYNKIIEFVNIGINKEIEDL